MRGSIPQSKENEKIKVTIKKPVVMDILFPNMEQGDCVEGRESKSEMRDEEKEKRRAGVYSLETIAW